MKIDKEIYEMARILCNNGVFCGATNCKTFYCPHKSIAEKLYDNGYRKTFTSNLATETQKAFKGGYIKGSIDRMNETYELAKLEDKIKNGDLVSKDWHDEQVLHAESEIERLQKVIKDKDDICYDCKKSVKEFADKLKEYARACKASGYDGIGENDIDELLKEYGNDD